jgi:thioredoxin 1
MPTRREALRGRLPAVAALLASVFVLGQGCEKKRTGKQVEPAEPTDATTESAPPSAPAELRTARPSTAPPKERVPAAESADAPAQEEAASSRPPAEPPRQADRPAASPERTPEAEPVEATVVVVTDANFADLTANGVVLVDFWAERCPPCRVQGPIVEKLAGRFAGRVAVGKLDVDASANRRTPRMFRIMYIPTLMIFRDGQEMKRFVGLQSEAVLASALEEALRE